MYDKIDGGKIINIQGLECCLPPVGYVYNIVTKKLEYTGVYKRSEIPEEQYWERPRLPDWYADVMKQWDNYDKKKKEDDPEFYDERLEEFKKSQWSHRLNGLWFMNYNPKTKVSEPKYLTGLYWFVLTWWQIDIGLASFTIPHLIKAQFFQYCVEDPFCFGMIDLTKRRFLKTFFGGAFITEKISRTKNANGGIQSKSGKDAKKVFSKAIVDPFRRLPKFFRPEYDMSLGINPKTEMRFQKTNVRGKKAEDGASKDELNSVIDWESADAIAYDGSKLVAYFGDEWGKSEGVNVFDRHEVIRYCLLDHEGRIIGKAIYSTTVEQVENEATDIDKAAKQLWDASDQNKRQENGQTSSGLYRFFQTADEAKNFDKYGYPDVEKNIKSILAERDAAKNNPRQLAARIRKEPRTVEDAFLISSDKCIYNTVNLANRKRFLIENPINKRGVLFYRDENTQSVRFRDVTDNESHFHWKLSPSCKLGELSSNKVKFIGSVRSPDNLQYGCIGVDGYSNRQGGQKYGSKASAWIGRRYDMNDPKNTGKLVGWLYGRPADKDDLWQQCMLASEYFGIQCFIEHVHDDYFSYFKSRGRLNYLGLYPLVSIPPEKREDAERHRGYPTTEFAINKCNDVSVSHVEFYSDNIDFIELIEDMEEYDPNDRTKSDATVSASITLVCLTEAPPIQEKRKEALIPTYGKPVLIEN